MQKIAYLAMDLHAKNCTLGKMDDHGSYKGNIEFSTCEKNVIMALKSIKASWINA